MRNKPIVDSLWVLAGLLGAVSCSLSMSRYPTEVIFDAGQASSGGKGANATGGSAAAGGGAASTGCDMAAAGSDGVEKPSGTPGNLTVLNWAGYKGAATYTFDDGNSSQIEHYPALQALGVHFTFYLVTTWSGASNSIWTQVVSDGHEIGNHTQTHPKAGTDAELDGASAFIQQKFGVRAWTMASPYGDSSYVSLAQTRFLINRGVSNALIKPNDSSNPFSLPCYIPPQNGTASTDFNPQIDSAESGGGWRVILVHGFVGGTDGAYQPVSFDEFVSGVNHAKSLGDMWIDSMVNVGAYWRGQKTFSSVTPTTSGSDQTWTWTLPDNFPPAKCLRVKVDGGTLTQNGKAVEWDGHGYYEISLDAGALTLSP